MDPLTIFVTVSTILAMGAIAFWGDILQWAQDSLLPWFQQELPEIAPWVSDAFSRLDNVVVAIRRRIIEAWRMLRPHLLKQVITFTKNEYGWVRQTATYLRKRLEPDAPISRKTETSEIPWEEIPDDIREVLIREGKQSISVDVTKERDQEIEMLEV